jgi:hypothetical protein
MKRCQVLLFVAALCFCGYSQAQLWSGVIAPARGTDWTSAGVPGGIPSGSWTQCGATISAYSGTANAINAAISNCGTNQYVLLGPGTFTLTSSIAFGGKSFVALRGSGANSTFLVFTSESAASPCNTGHTQGVGMCGTQAYYPALPPPNIYNWTAGYAQGSNQITLSSVANIQLLGSGTSPTFLVLNQDDDGYTGLPATGGPVDNGNYFVCADWWTGTVGCTANGPDGSLGTTLNNRWQEEVAVATAINQGGCGATCVTISPSLRHPNWRSGQTPTLWLTASVQQEGLENLSIDVQNISGDLGVGIWGCYQCWVSGTRVMNFYNFGVFISESVHSTIQNSYFYNGAGPDPYGILDQGLTADCLFINNIFQAVRSPIVYNGSDSASVIAYNFAVNDQNNTGSGDAMFQAFWAHAAGDDFQLFEGNISPGPVLDNLHGTHLNSTEFRNFSTGWESCANGNCGTYNTKDFGTTPVPYGYGARYGAVIGNVAGTPGFHTVYQSTLFGGQYVIDNFGYGNPDVPPPGCNGNGGCPLPPDPLVASTMLRWGNWDVVTGAVRWCGNSSDTGWSTTCNSTSEVPTGAPVYPNPVPTLGDTGANQGPLPKSFLYSSTPSWWPSSIPWPPIGPDVTAGNVGICTGKLNTPGQFAGVPATSSAQCTGTSLNANALGGHVNAIPAMSCYLNVMGGLPDGTGSALAFNANTCYGDPPPPPAPPTDLSAVVE